MDIKGQAPACFQVLEVYADNDRVAESSRTEMVDG
jgi:hypothetical protein